MIAFVVAEPSLYAGRYPFDLDRDFSTREYGWIKRLAGYLPLEIEQGWSGGDSELRLVLVLIAMHRAGRVAAADVPQVFDSLADAPGTFLQLESEPEAPGAAEPEDPMRASTPENSGPKAPSSGLDSATSSAISANGQNSSGMPESAISGSAPAGSAT